MYGGAANSQWEYTRVGFDRTRSPLSPEVASLLNERINRCSVLGEENTVVRINNSTYIDVGPRKNTPHLVGWTTGSDTGKPGQFFEVERTLSNGGGGTAIVEVLGNKNAVWNMTCVPDTNHYHIDESGIAHKVLRVIDINGHPLDRVMPYWLPILHKLGDSSRGSAWRMPVLYINMRDKKIDRALGAHIPLSGKMLEHPSIQKLFSADYSKKTVKCIFDMSKLHIEKVGNSYEYLVASGTLASGNSVAVPLVIGVYNSALGDNQ